ncbi:MAG: BlaI/MecI/CopY family transcriptional regulator [Bacteroidales bacterium]|nr:BlaI/MecI/CopY family transcriptional regulator [Lentimicrobiaceae bacterium]MDD5694218.1 BlaI/MecI/CopY family transcriptional regulator [Bacteroidales bacterium]
MKELTRAEEQIMRILWRIRKGYIKDILNEIREPRPAYNTVSTIVRILEKKKIVGHRAFGKSHEYYPLITQKEYMRKFLKGFVRDYFSSSYASLASFFAREEQLSLLELEEIKALMEHKINEKKKSHER